MLEYFYADKGFRLFWEYQEIRWLIWALSCLWSRQGDRNQRVIENVQLYKKDKYNKTQIIILLPRMKTKDNFNCQVQKLKKTSKGGLIKIVVIIVFVQ